MPSIDQNQDKWSSYAWKENGDEWSSIWGGTHGLWNGSILPRIKAWLPAGNILELAPGFGRCTQFLVSQCSQLVIVDLTEKCIAHCKERFQEHSNIHYFVNDGKSLDMIPDNSIDFVFSWDSFVHVESEVIFSYLHQLAKKLKPGGAGFIHHSNIGAYHDPASGRLGVANPHWRAESMSADIFRTHCEQAGMHCVSQEKVNWGGDILNDCFSIFTRPVSANNLPTRVVENNRFMEEAARIKNQEKTGSHFPVQPNQSNGTPPRILFVCHDFPPYRYAGAQLYALNLAKELKRQGLANVDIFHPVFREGYDRYEVASAEFEGLTVFRLSKDITTGYDNSVRHPVVADLFDQFLAAHHYDIIHIHGLGQLSAVPIEIAKRHGIPTIMTLHDYWLLCAYWHLMTPDQQLCVGPESPEKCAPCFLKFHEFNNPPANLPALTLDYMRTRISTFHDQFAKLDVAFAPSRFLAGVFDAFGFHNIRVNPLGMPPMLPVPKVLHKGLVFGFVGQIITRKGIETLLTAFSRINSPDVSLEIWGKSDNQAYLDEVTAFCKQLHNVHYNGGYTPDLLPSIFACIDVAIVPSLMENYPLVVQEAFMNNTPVIASCAGGIPEVVVHNYNGLLFEVCNASDLEEKLRYLMANPAKISEYCANIAPVKTIAIDAGFYAGIYKQLTHGIPQQAHVSPKPRILFYFFKNVHIPILKPIYDACKRLHPEAEIGFACMPHSPEMRAGFTPEELKLIHAFGEKMYQTPQEFRPDITFIADSVYPWVQGCGRLVHVGHGVLSKGQYYTDTDIARREEQADLVCVPGEYHAEVMRRIISKPVAATGMAKLDPLFSGAITRATELERLNLPPHFRYVLFAPTFNDELSAMPYIRDRIAEVLPDDRTVLLIKLHGSTSAGYKEMYRNLGMTNPRVLYCDDLDITPFLAIADVMISDVSSSMMEFAALDKPLVLFNNPLRTSYANYNPDDIEFRWRDIGIEVNDLAEMKAAVAYGLSTPGFLSAQRRTYTDMLFANKHDGKGAERIVREAFRLVG